MRRNAGAGAMASLVGLTAFGWIIQNIEAIMWAGVVIASMVAVLWFFYRIGINTREREAEHAAIANRADVQERLLADGDPVGWSGFYDRTGIDWRTTDSVL